MLTKTMADVVPYVVKTDGVPWQMLLLYGIGKMLYHRGRCCNLLLSKVADIIAIMLCVADGKPPTLHVTTFINFNIRYYCKVADGITTKGWV